MLRLNYLILSVGALWLAGGAPASAQVAQGSPAPEFSVVDENGVDLISGMPQFNRKEVSIGNGDSALRRMFQFYMYDDNNTGRIQVQAPTGATQLYTFVSFGSKSAVFAQTNGVYTDIQGKGDQLSCDSATTPTCIYIDRDGTKATFYGGNITLIVSPDGSSTTFNYETSTPPTINSITTSSGYGLFYSYPSSGDFNAISAINLGKQFCAATSTSCIPTSGATGTEYTYADPQFSTQSGTSSDQLWTIGEDLKSRSALGRTITYHRETDGETIPGTTTAWVRHQTYEDIEHPIEGTETYTFGEYDNEAQDAGDIANRIVQVTKDGLTWTYGWHYCCGLQGVHATGVTVDYPGQGSRTLTFSLIPFGTRVTQDSLTLADGTVRTKTYSWDSYGRLTQVTNPGGDYATYVYDGRGNVTSVTKTPKPGSTLAAQTTAYGFSSTCTNIVTCNKPLYMIDPKGNRTDYTYDSVHGGILTETLPADANGIRPQVRYTYAQLTASILSSSGQLVSGPAVWKLTSKAYCRTTASCGGGADETVTTYTYDANLQLTGETVKTGDGTLLTSTTKTYDPIGNVIQVLGPLGPSDITKNTYDADRELLVTASPDPDGTGPLGVIATRHGYDADGHETSVQSGYAADQSDASLNAMTVTKTLNRTLDSLGRPTLEQLLGGSSVVTETQYSYNSDGRLECKTVRMNASAFASPPASACSLGTTGSYGPDRITRTTYDAADELLQVQKGYGTPLQESYATYTYTPNGKQQYVTDADGNKAQLTYDGFDRLVQWNFPDKVTKGSVSSSDYEQYGYDADGNRTSLRKRDGTTIAYVYDALNRMTLKTEPSGPSVYYGYDLQGHELYARFDSASGLGITSTYDGLGRLLSSTTNQSGASLTVSHQYDAAGNRMRVTHPDGNYFTYSYDELSRLTAIYENGATAIASMSYDNNGEVTTLTRASTSTTYGYDSISRPTSIADDLAGTAGDETETLTYTPADQIVTETRSNGAFAFSGFVSVNRNYTINGLNQYTAAGPANFGYDANGNLTSDGTNSYTYDPENRLVSASGATNSTLVYDPLGRLYQVSGGTSGTTRFLYDGDELVAEYDGFGNLLRRYVHGSAQDDPLIWYEGGVVSSSTRRSLQDDHEGSIVSVADDAGNLVHVNTYDESGIPAAGNLGRFQYTGQAYLLDLGMYYYKARMYSATLGRFMQTDPVGYKDQINLYEYVGGDPLNRADPSGMGSCMGSGPNQSEVNCHEYANQEQKLQMTVSPAGVSFIKGWEGWNGTFDKESGKWLPKDDGFGNGTIGWGHNCGICTEFSNGISKSQGDALLSDDLSKIEKTINSMNLDLKQNQFDSLVDFAFNVRNFQRSTLFSNVKGGSPVIEDNFTAYAHAHLHGRLITVPSLMKRRESEFNLYQNGDYDSNH